METRFKEVYFDNFCSQCINEEKEENESPCDECLEYGAREDSHTPFHFKDKDE